VALASPCLDICKFDPKSRAEMEALAELPNVQVQWLAKGMLAIHEEFPDAVAAAVRSFLSG
jgi:hypothetical protein